MSLFYATAHSLLKVKRYYAVLKMLTNNLLVDLYVFATIIICLVFFFFLPILLEFEVKAQISL